MTEQQQRTEVKIANVLQKGLTVLEKVTAQQLTLTKAEMIDLINFETAVKFIVECEQKAEQKLQAVAPDVVTQDLGAEAAA